MQSEHAAACDSATVDENCKEDQMVRQRMADSQAGEKVTFAAIKSKAFAEFPNKDSEFEHGVAQELMRTHNEKLANETELATR